MTAFRVTPGSVKVSASTMAQAVSAQIRTGQARSPELEQRLLEGPMREMELDVAARVADHFQALIDTAGKVLDDPQASPNDTGGVRSRRITFTYRHRGRRQASENLLSGRQTTMAWLPLTERYRKRKPRSSTFWRKTGRLGFWFEVASEGYFGVSADRPELLIDQPATLRHYGRGTFRGQFSVGLYTTSEHIDKVFTEPFLSGRIVPDALGSIPGVNRRDYSVLRYPEAYRPWLSRLATIAGAQLRKELLSF